MKAIMVTGGAGYIGSHVVTELAENGYHPVIVDNFSNSTPATIVAIERLVRQPITYYACNFQDDIKVRHIIEKEHIEGVIHIAGYKAVGESVQMPLKYYDNNVAGLINLLKVLLENNVKTFIFSSSAAVYGTPPTPSVSEDTSCQPTSPYGWSKYMDEIILRDTCKANPQLRGIALRYFNVVGSHESAIIGESPKNAPQNLLPIIVRAVSSHSPLTVFGTDYPTPDGTNLRDYIHVVDLARAHVSALEHAFLESKTNYNVFNIGTGKPTSVLEMINAFERVNHIKVPYALGKRRDGDPVAYYALVKKAEAELHWHAEKTVDDAVKSAWLWYQRVASGNTKEQAFSGV